MRPLRRALPRRLEAQHGAGHGHVERLGGAGHRDGDVAVEVRRRASAPSPWASLPSTTAVGRVKSTSAYGVAAGRRWRPAAADRAHPARRAPPPRTTLPTPRPPRGSRRSRRPRPARPWDCTRRPIRARGGLPPRPPPRRCAPACPGCRDRTSATPTTTRPSPASASRPARRASAPPPAPAAACAWCRPSPARLPSSTATSVPAARDPGGQRRERASARGPKYDRLEARAAVERGVDRPRALPPRRPARPSRARGSRSSSRSRLTARVARPERPAPACVRQLRAPRARC